MNRRLQQFLVAENVSQSQFADTIGVARASVSHILAGRNKPGFDFLESMARHYPALNLEWLITGKGRMYSSSAPSASPVSSPSSAASEVSKEEPKPQEQLFENELFEREPESSTQKPETQRDIKPPVVSEKGSEKASTQLQMRNIVRVVIFYDDNTYRELK